MGDSAATSGTGKLAPGTGMALVGMAAAVFVVCNDFTAPAVALPTIEKAFNTDIGSVQWVINAYALIFGILIVPGGRLADMFGRRRMFFIGSAIFAGFSALAGAAQSPAWLIAARALMGIGGAMMWPATVGMTFALLPKEKAGLAGGLILGVAGLGNACGPLIGGLLTEQASWRWIFFLNVPIAIAACTIMWLKVHQPAEGVRERLDYAGTVVLSIGLAALLIALDQSTDWGFGDWRVLLLLFGTVAMLTLFVRIERRAGSHALIPAGIIKSREFAACCGVTLLLSATFYSMVLYLPQFMQKLLGFGPLKAGAGLLPMMVTFSVVSFAGAPLYARVGAKKMVVTGAFFYLVAGFLLSLPGVDSPYLALVPGMIVGGLGLGIFLSSNTTAAVTSVDEEHASLASGLVFMFQTAGGSLGLGLTTAVFTASAQSTVHADKLADGLSQVQEHAVNGVLAGTDSAAALVEKFPGAAAHLQNLASSAFVDGMHAAFRLDAALALAGIVIAALYIGGRLKFTRAPRPRPVEAPPETVGN
jgi:EmrB/QacA subfamily drug resistance transporter